MARPNVLSTDTKLYCPAEPEGRVFPAGSEWPGDVWSEKPGGEIAGAQTTAQAVKDLLAAQDQAEALQAQLESALHAAAQADARAGDAEKRMAEQAQQLRDAQQALATAEETAATVTAERDQAVANASGLQQRAEAAETAAADAKATIERLTGELNTANQALADAKSAKTAKAA
jgi:chromosome segregation ATPase